MLDLKTDYDRENTVGLSTGVTRDSWSQSPEVRGLELTRRGERMCKKDWKLHIVFVKKRHHLCQSIIENVTLGTETFDEWTNTHM